MKCEPPPHRTDSDYRTADKNSGLWHTKTDAQAPRLTAADAYYAYFPSVVLEAFINPYNYDTEDTLWSSS